MFYGYLMKAMYHILILHLLNGGFLAAQPLSGNQYVRAELITDAEDFGRPFSIGIRFTIEPDWYLYWKNPGDAGLPVQITWELPENWTASAIEHPTPKKFLHDNIVAYGYKREVILFATITPTQTQQYGVVKAKLDWLVCKESCVRGNAEVSFNLAPRLEESLSWARKTLQPFRAMLPGKQQESGILLSQPVVRTIKGEMIVSVTLTGEKVEEVLDFFPETLENVLIDFSTVRVSRGELLMKISPRVKVHRVILKGLLITRRKSYEYAIPIELPTS